MNSGVYQVRNQMNGKRYIGSAVDLEVRRKRHYRELKGQYHHNIHLQRAYNLHGKIQFVFEIIETCGISLLSEREQFHIDSYDFKTLYNELPNAYTVTGYKHSEEALEKMRVANRGKNNPMYGRRGEDSPTYGKKKSEETKRRISLSKGKEVAQLDVESGEVINTFCSTQEAARAVNGHASNISACARGRVKTVCGYNWEYTK